MAKLSFHYYTVKEPGDWPRLMELLKEGWEIYCDDKAESSDGKVKFYFILNREVR